MQDKMPLISVSVAIYNVEDYLEECIESLLAQTYKNVELILVDDGSTDDSSVICENYERKYSNIRLIRQENHGLSSARNTGIDNSNGEYLCFVDGDDYVSPVFIEALYSQINKKHCLMSCVRHGVSFFDNDIVELDNNLDLASESTLLTEEEYQEELLYQKSWNGTVWRMCSASLFQEIEFPLGILFEDLATTYQLVHKAGSVAVLDSTRLYAYRQRSSGIMRSKYSSLKKDSCKIVTAELQANISNWYPQLNDAVSSRMFAVARVVYAQTPPEAKSDKKELWELIVLCRNTVLFDRKARRREKLAAMVSFLGRNMFSAFCHAYKTILKSQ